jgi:hypothetical protein
MTIAFPLPIHIFVSSFPHFSLFVTRSRPAVYYKTRNEEMGNEKWGNKEMKKWGRQAPSGDEKLRYRAIIATGVLVYMYAYCVCVCLYVLACLGAVHSHVQC